MEQGQLKENVILIDADYVDSIAYNLSDNFSRMLFRDIPAADLADWLVCAALDGGVPEGENEVQCIFLHGEDKLMLEQFYPAELAHELDGTAFRDAALGEFQMSCLKVESLAGDDFFSQCAEVLLSSPQVKRLVLVPDTGVSGERLGELAKEAATDKAVTLLSMTPQEGFPHVMLGYSLMHAMGIKSDELT